MNLSARVYTTMTFVKVIVLSKLRAKVRKTMTFVKVIVLSNLRAKVRKTMTFRDNKSTTSERASCP